jgi:hypothetical protein
MTGCQGYCLSTVCQSDVQVCEQAHVPLEVVPLSEEYWARVVSHSIAEVRAGRTPNPDVLCNSRCLTKPYRTFPHPGRGLARTIRLVSKHVSPTTAISSFPCENLCVEGICAERLLGLEIIVFVMHITPIAYYVPSGMIASVCIPGMTLIMQYVKDPTLSVQLWIISHEVQRVKSKRNTHLRN